MSSPLNRRGSRSEGRLNIAVQDRIAESERHKKESHIPVSKITDGISGVTLVTNDVNNLNERLGGAGRGGFLKQFGDFRPRTAADILKNNTKGGKLSENNDRSLSVDKGMKSIKDSEIVNTKFLVDSSTITIPLSNASQIAAAPAVPKYKTMPSPTRPNTILTGNNCLNEIFEEGTDVGSSDSATTTPRPISRQNHFVTNRTQSHSSATTATTSQRRSKFHKTRTTSCSSSDASDDDSENRKKRVHKIVDVVKPIQYRRDSHDDSSDSQDPGNAAATGGNSTSSHIVHITTSTTNTTTHQDSSNQQSGQQPNGRAKNVQQIGGFRRHRAGRRRSGETRLRESQSLNRITEVQESEITLSALVNPAPNITVNPPTTKPKGFSARLFQGFRKSDNNSTNSTPPQDKPRVPPQTEPPDDEVDMVLGPELAKALRATETKNSSSTTKKLKILGKYFQVSSIYITFISIF